MHPLDRLHQDHLAFRDRFTAMEARLDHVANRQSLGEDRDGLAADLEFMRTAVLEHFRREDEALLPRMEGKVGRFGGSLVGVLWYEHEELRRAVAKFAEALEAAAGGNVEELNRHGLFFIQVLQDHVRKEEAAFFVQARQVLTEADWTAVAAAMDR